MVGYDPNTPRFRQMEVAIAGALSGIITRGLCQPLDVLKIRFQLQTSNKLTAKYRTILQATNVIIKDEGVKALWKGHISAQLLSIVYGISQFCSYEFCTYKAHELNLDQNLKPLVHFLCGSLAGSTATLCSFPFDVIRTRLVAQNENEKIYKGVTHAFIKIYRNEGVFTFFRGLTPTVIQVAPHTGAQFMFYKFFINVYNSIFPPIENGTNKSRYNITFSGSLICGSLAGLCAKTIIYPLDLTKKRMQVQGNDMQLYTAKNNLNCNGFIDCLYKTVTKEGFKGLFKGLSPSLLKAVCTSALHFSIYEEACKILYNLRKT